MTHSRSFGPGCADAQSPTPSSWPPTRRRCAHWRPAPAIHWASQHSTNTRWHAAVPRGLAPLGEPPPSRPSGASFAAVELMYTPRVYTLLLLAGETAPSYFLMMEFASGGDLMGPPSIPSHGPFLLLALPRPALRRAHLNATGQAWFTIAAVRALEGSLLATMHSTTGGKGALKIRPKSRFSQACCTAPSP